jgi:hypothetical protein
MDPPPAAPVLALPAVPGLPLVPLLLPAPPPVSGVFGFWAVSVEFGDEGFAPVALGGIDEAPPLAPGVLCPEPALPFPDPKGETPPPAPSLPPAAPQANAAIANTRAA